MFFSVVGIMADLVDQGGVEIMWLLMGDWLMVFNLWRVHMGVFTVEV